MQSYATLYVLNLLSATSAIALAFLWLTERAALRATARQRDLLLDSISIGIVVVNEDLRCTLVNRGAAEMLGLSQAGLLGNHVTNLIGDEGSVLDFRRAFAGAASVTTGETVFGHGNGSSVPVEYSVGRMAGTSGSTEAVLTFTDLTRRRRLEAQLEQAGRVASLGRLAATVAHEFNNVLMGISPFAEVLRRDNVRPEVRIKALEHIGSALERGKRITSEILRFTQPAEPVLSPVNVGTLLSDFVSEASSLLPDGQEVRIEGDERLFVNGDRNLLHQTLTNLVLNARDAMPHGGTIVIGARRGASGVHLYVSDTGVGMPRDVLDHVFEPLFTTKRSGTGLGLSVVHQIVTRHGGEIFAESKPGTGTTFHIFLPAAEAPEVPDHTAQVEAKPKSTTILLVEDDLTVASGLEAVLSAENMAVSIASTGASAIQSVKDERPDVVILDIGLPDTDGYVVYDRIRQIHPEVLVIFSTGHADPRSLERVLAHPRTRFLQKPYDANALFEAIRQSSDSR